jgi:hypothetical protein
MSEKTVKPRNRVRSYRLNPLQLLLLRAALWKGSKAVRAWEKWAHAIDLESIDPGSYRLLPQLFKNMNSHGISHPLLDKIKGTYRYTWYRNQMKYKQLEELLGSFESAGIRTMVIKGAALVELYYKDRGVRPMADLDIMVPVSQVSGALRLLEKLNWNPIWISWDELTAEFRSYLNAVEFQRAKNVDVDLHWHMLSTSLGKNADDAVWKTAVPLQIGHMRTLAPSAADHLLLVCVHGVWWNEISSLRWVADALFIINGSAGIDWDRLIEQARRQQTVLPLKEALGFLKKEMEAPIPGRVMGALHDSPVTWIDWFEFKSRMSPRTTRGPVLSLMFHFAQYSRAKIAPGFVPRVFGFLHYFKHIWHLRHLRQLPLRALKKAAHIMIRFLKIA